MEIKAKRKSPICNGKCLRCEYYDNCLRDRVAKERRHQRYIANKDKYKANVKKWIENNKERYIEYHKQYDKKYRETHDRTEYMREYYRKHRDEINEKNKERYHKNKENEKKIVE